MDPTAALLISYFIFAVGVAALADFFRRSPLAWLGVSLIISPIGAVLVLIVLSIAEQFRTKPIDLPPRSKARIAVSGLIFLAGAGYGVLLLYAYLSADFVVGQMPDCASQPVRGLLIQAVNESPRGKMLGLRVSEVTDIKTAIAGEPRSCTATLYTNSGKLPVAYTIEWITAAKDKIWLQANF